MTSDASTLTNHATSVPPASTSGVVRAGILRSFAAFLGRYPNLAIKKIVESAGLDPRLFGNPNAMIDARRNAAMLDLFAETSNDSALALQYAQHVAWGDLGPLAYIVMNSPTVGVAIANACRYFRLQGTGGGTTLEIDHGEAQQIGILLAQERHRAAEQSPGIVRARAAHSAGTDDRPSFFLSKRRSSQGNARTANNIFR